MTFATIPPEREATASAPECPPTEVVKVEEKVREKVGGRLRSFRIEVDPAGLVLRGNAPTYYVKCLAQQAVMETTNVRIAMNRIDVLTPEPTGREKS